jgi:DNA repair protein RAD51
VKIITALNKNHSLKLNKFITKQIHQYTKMKHAEKEVAVAEQAEEEEMELDGPTPIKALEEKGINAGDIKKLEEAGFHTVESVAFTPKKALVLVKGLSEAKVEKLIEACQKIVNLGFQTASTYFEKR